MKLLTSQRNPAGKDEDEQARELAKDLGYHALALDVTASALMSSAATKPFGVTSRKGNLRTLRLEAAF